jgi:hypothetical protein
MTRHAFFFLLRLVRTDLETNTTMAEKSSGSPVTPLIKLAATIRWLVWHDTQPSCIHCVVFCCVVFCCVVLCCVFYLLFAIFLCVVLPCVVFCCTLSALPIGRRHVYWYMCSFWPQPILLLPPGSRTIVADHSRYRLRPVWSCCFWHKYFCMCKICRGVCPFLTRHANALCVRGRW